jgi:hypothetical protein
MCHTLILFIYGTCHAHILDICLCPHINLCIEYNHLNMHGMICTQRPTFFSIFFSSMQLSGKTLSLGSTLSLSNLQLLDNRNLHYH